MLAIALLVVIGLVVVAALDPRLRPADRTTASAAPTARGTPETVDDAFDATETNPDGSVTVTLDDAAATGLVTVALANASIQRLRDVSVELVEPEGGADGRMIVSGRLDEAPLPVEAVVDLRVVDDAVRPTIRDVRVGPFPLPAGTRGDLERQVRELALLVEDRLTVERLSTSEGVLLLTGRRR